MVLPFSGTWGLLQWITPCVHRHLITPILALPLSGLNTSLAMTTPWFAGPATRKVAENTPVSCVAKKQQMPATSKGNQASWFNPVFKMASFHPSWLSHLAQTLAGMIGTCVNNRLATGCFLPQLHRDLQMAVNRVKQPASWILALSQDGM